MIIYKPLMQVGGEYDGQFKAVAYDRDTGNLKYQAFMAYGVDYYYPEDECWAICTALQIAYDTGVEETAHTVIDKLAVE